MTREQKEVHFRRFKLIRNSSFSTILALQIPVLVQTVQTVQ